MGLRYSRRRRLALGWDWLLLGSLGGASLAVWLDSQFVAWNADELELSAPNVQFALTETTSLPSGHLIYSSCKMMAGLCQEMPQGDVVAIREVDHDSIIEMS